MIKYNAFTIAKYFLYRQSMSQKKLHKMMFFAYAWYLYYENDDIDHLVNKLFDAKIPSEGFQAWVHGPVFREIYPLYADYSYRDIEVESFDMSLIDVNDLAFFDEIFGVYGNYNADQLEDISHLHTAWINARKGYAKDEVCKKVLSDQDIYQYLDEM